MGVWAVKSIVSQSLHQLNWKEWKELKLVSSEWFPETNKDLQRI